MKIVFMLGVIIILLMFGIYVTRRKAKKDRLTQQMKIEMLENNYETLLQMYEKKSILVHDMKNHMLALAKMVEERQEGVLVYITQLAGEMRHGINFISTNHKMLDSILNMKLQEAQEAQIKVQCKCDDMGNLNLTLVEICALFTNLLDNAIEANKRLPAGMERKMDMVCRKRGTMLIVSVSNPVWIGADTEGETSLKTTKEDKDMHGFGLLSMKKVVGSHDGYIKTNISNNKFHIVVYLTGFKK